MYYISINKIHFSVRKYNDLYVEIEYNNKKRRTTVIWNKTHPEWNEKFIFDLDNNVDHFTITIYEKNVWTYTETLHKNKIKLNKNKIDTFKYKYLEITHGIPFKKLREDNQCLIEENNYFKEKNNLLKDKIMKKDDEISTLKNKLNIIKNDFQNIKDICNKKR